MKNINSVSVLIKATFVITGLGYADYRHAR